MKNSESAGHKQTKPTATKPNNKKYCRRHKDLSTLINNNKGRGSRCVRVCLLCGKFSLPPPSFVVGGVANKQNQIKCATVADSAVALMESVNLPMSSHQMAAGSFEKKGYQRVEYLWLLNNNNNRRNLFIQMERNRYVILVRSYISF